MRQSRAPGAFTIAELLAALLVIAILLAVTLPLIAGVRGASGVHQSMSNLTTLGVAHVLYAADWEGRQVTWTRDDLGVYGGDVVAYNQAHGCGYGLDPNCYPPIIAGWGANQEGDYVLWAYWAQYSNSIMLMPLLFPGDSSSIVDGYGHYRIPNSRPFHDYLNGRYHDPAYYAPNDTSILEDVEPCLDAPGEFIAYPTECNPGWSSYSLSPAAMYHPDVWRSNAAGGWQHPFTLDHSFQSPSLFQAVYPDLKTHMLEHRWLQGPPADCNPALPDFCVPFYFNQGLNSTPVTLFYDGSVRLLSNAEALASDQQVLVQTGGEDGLWHRGTPFGDDGYFIDTSWDGVAVSHHVLTTDGILGRDTLGESIPLHLSPGERTRGLRAFRRADDPEQPRLPIDLLPFTPEGGEP